MHSDAADAHSLYIETLVEFGLVGLALLLVVVLGIARPAGDARPRPAARSMRALFAIALIWALEAGVDWQWEMPAATIVFFAARWRRTRPRRAGARRDAGVARRAAGGRRGLPASRA